MTPTLSTALLVNLPAGVLLCESDSGTVTWVNDAACELLSATRDELVGATADALLGAPRGGGATTQRHQIRTVTGERRWLQCQRTIVETPEDGQVTLRTLTDITEFQARSKGRSAVMVGRDVSQLDAESGVLNRRALLTELGAEVSRSRRYGNPLSAILVRFSDCGRLVDGDVENPGSRRQVAQTINEMLRWVDIVGVLENGEFLVVLPETAMEPAMQVRTKVEAALAALRDADPVITSAVACSAWSKGDIPAHLIDRLKADAEARANAPASENAA